MSTETLAMTAALREYILSVSLKETKVLQELREETRQLKNFNMQISPEQGQFMAMLAQLINAKKALELGTFTGYSALAVALALPEQGSLITCDVDPITTAMAKRYWALAGVANKIELKLAPALDTLKQLIETEAQTFDFIFIDADKGNYINYYEAAVTLLRSGGLIVIDNVLWEGEVANPDNHEGRTLAIRALNKRVFNDSRVSCCIIPLSDGLTLARKI